MQPARIALQNEITFRIELSLHHQRNPNIRESQFRPAKLARGDANDRESLLVETNLFAQNIRFRAEPTRPEGVAQNGDRMSSGRDAVLRR